MNDLSPVVPATVEIESSLGALPMPKKPEKPTVQEISAFTSAKLDLINWILRDHRPMMNPSAKITAIYLLQCVNSTTLQCNPSYQTIADAMGFKNEKTAERAVKAVKACGWIDIRRFNRNKSNRYVFLANASVAKAIDEYQDHLRDQRKAERESELAKLEQTNLSGRTVPDPTFLSPLEQTNLSGKHLKGTPEVGSLKERGEDLSRHGSVLSSSSPDDVPYPVPASEAEATAMLEQLAAGHALSPGVMKVFRRHMMAGTLTPAMVEQQRKFAA
ncbi:MAG: hypothetical protein E5W74_26715 [Mesorhizobium sp.]|uniref:helix-turn-helix domain-containing protein n=1 Tax=Mesorhizobium sp. TaxID=1871066 RepID=UPI00121912C8|nr:helix-turn-helix domain-containing protein [Mesorhizobium sp.]TIT07318.1 MAG: hypothetical protein E5W74_26715 [Mesorhizobium sp.]